MNIKILDKTKEKETNRSTKFKNVKTANLFQESMIVDGYLKHQSTLNLSYVIIAIVQFEINLVANVLRWFIDKAMNRNFKTKEKNYNSRV